MKPRSFVLLCVVGGLVIAPASLRAAASSKEASPTAKSTVTLPQTPRFNQVRARVETLYQHRNETPPPPHPRTNPFRPPGAVVPVAAGETPKPGLPPEPASDLATLEKGAATLKISGIFEIGGRSHLVINGRPYKEGDVVATQVNGDTVYLRVRTIARRNVTLTLNAAEMTLKF
jgi:hypothetical protein